MSDRILEYRVNLGTRLAQVTKIIGKKSTTAELAGITTEQLKRWTNGEVKVPAEGLIKLAEAANVDFGWLCTGEGNSDEKSHQQTERKADQISGELLDKVKDALTGVRKETGLRLRDSDWDWFFDYIMEKAKSIKALAENEEQEDLLIKMMVMEERKAIQNPRPSNATDQIA